MAHPVRLGVWVWLVVWGCSSLCPAGPRDIVTYAGGPGPQRFLAVFPLSDGSVLVSGSAANLDWIAPDVPRTELNASAINSHRSERVAFILHLSPDLRKILHVVSLPFGLTSDIRFIKSTNVPGMPTGDLFISGPRDCGVPRAEGGDMGYFIAKLNGNFVAHPPTALTWVYNVAAVDVLKQAQPWDVGSDGKVYYGAGEPFSSRGWAAIYRLTAEGKVDKVENWRFHMSEVEGQPMAWHGVSASGRSDTLYSTISLKLSERGSLRSWSEQDYRAVLPDGNGGVKQGRWPLDGFYPGPFNPAASDANVRGAGYTGLTVGLSDSLQLGAIVVDRRTNHLYFGCAIQCRLPNEKTGVEAMVVAMTQTGALQWWSRLHTECRSTFPPQHFIDGLAIDYSAPPEKAALVVLGRCYGNDLTTATNFWRGDQVKAPGNPGRAYQSRFDGQKNDCYISWLGRLTLAEGTLLHACYVGEYAEGGLRIDGNFHTYKDPNLDGWLDHDAGLADVDATLLRPTLTVDAEGRIYIIGRGRRVVTTAGAYQKMIKPSQGASDWSQFVRVYKQDLSTLIYSSLLTGQWNKMTGAEGDNTVLWGICPVSGGLLVGGYHMVDADGILMGNPVPVQNVVPWGTKGPAGEEALLGRLYFSN